MLFFGDGKVVSIVLFLYPLCGATAVANTCTFCRGKTFSAEGVADDVFSTQLWKKAWRCSNGKDVTDTSVVLLRPTVVVVQSVIRACRLVALLLTRESARGVLQASVSCAVCGLLIVCVTVQESYVWHACVRVNLFCIVCATVNKDDFWSIFSKGKR